MRGVANLNLEHKSIYLCFGERIGAFMLNRILRRQNKKRIVKRISRPTDCYLPLLHRFK